MRRVAPSRGSRRPLRQVLPEIVSAGSIRSKPAGGSKRAGKSWPGRIGVAGEKVLVLAQAVSAPAIAQHRSNRDGRRNGGVPRLIGTPDGSGAGAASRYTSRHPSRAPVEGN